MNCVELGGVLGVARKSRGELRDINDVRERDIKLITESREREREREREKREREGENVAALWMAIIC